MVEKNMLFDFHWDVDKYKANYDPEYWNLCRTFMVTHKTKYPEQKLVHLTEAFYQIGVYGSSYDPKTSRMVSALAIEVLDRFLELHPGFLKHPFNKSAVVIPEVVDITEEKDDSSSNQDSNKNKSTQPASIWDVAVDSNIIANVLTQPHLKSLLKGFVIIYDVRRESKMNDNKVSILEESFRRSKFGPCHWNKENTQNNICPIRLSLKWKGTVMAEAVGTEEKTLSIRLAQAVLSKIANFSPGIEAKWSYYRDGRMPDIFDRPNPRKSNIYRVTPRSQFRAMAEITSFIDTFANSDSFAEIIFGMDYSNHEKKQITEYITKSWGTRLTYRTVNKTGAKSNTETHVCMYHIRTGDEIRRWLDRCGGENERYRLVPPGQHRRAGACDKNVREVLKCDTVDLTEEDAEENTSVKDIKKKDQQGDQSLTKKSEITKKTVEEEKNKNIKTQVKDQNMDAVKIKPSAGDEKKEEVVEESLEKLLDGFVLFYDAKKNSEINKDDWFSALCDSFKSSKFGPLEVITEDIRPLRMRCTFKWNNKTLASAEGLSETQAKTAATLQLISKLEPFTYIIQAKEEYFHNGKVPPFVENPDASKSNVYRIVRRKDLPSYYSIFQTIDDFVKKPPYSELIFGADFTWELKNEIVVYIKAKSLDYRYFTNGDQKPWTHMAVYHSIKPENLKNYLLKNGGETAKYKLIPPQKAEVNSTKTVEVDTPTVSKPQNQKAPVKVLEKRKPLKDPQPVEEPDSNKIQIKLKNFKKEKVEYPEDTGGDFPGLILWVGLKKNSSTQRNLFCILLESFKMSKYGELVIEESEEAVWGRREPLKKCVIKSNRKVLAVGLGESKAEAKHSASMQILRQLRQHCYAIQAKESYFKEGKATPYDFNPDPAKEHVYKLARRNKFKDKGAIIKFVDDFARKFSSEEIIFGDDFTYDEREFILQHCRHINLNYRLMKCQSVAKVIHTHIAVFHHRPPPAIKAELMSKGGEDERFYLIPPKGKITFQTSDLDMWPESLDSENKGNQIPVLLKSNGQFSSTSANTPQNANIRNVQSSPKVDRRPVGMASVKPELNVGKRGPDLGNLTSLTHTPNKRKTPIIISGTNPNRTSIELNKQTPTVDPQPQGPCTQDVSFGPQPFHMPLPDQDAPLAFGPQPLPTVYTQNIEIVPQIVQTPELDPSSSMNNFAKTGISDLREELARKRQAENQTRKTPERMVYHMDDERKIIHNDGDSDSWSRTVFVSEPESKIEQEVRSSNEDLRNKLKQKDSSKDRTLKQRPGDDRPSRMSPERNRQRISAEKRRITPDRERKRALSPGRSRRRLSPPRNHKRNLSGDRFKFQDKPRESRIVRERDISKERRFSREHWKSRSPTSPIPSRGETRLRRSLSPNVHFRDLWEHIPVRFSETMFMYKYIKQDSTVERDPFALLRATRSLECNIDFEFFRNQIAIDEWEVNIELVADNTNLHPLVGEGIANSCEEARVIAAYHAVDTIQKSCRVVEPNYRYFAEGGIPDFIARKSPMKTHIYEIIQNLNPTRPLDRYTVECMFDMFLRSSLEDLFFLASDFSYLERVLVIDVANQMNLWWRLFGPRHPDALPDDVVSTQHICIQKRKSALQLIRELLANAGSSEKYTVVDPRESRITQPSNWSREGLLH